MASKARIDNELLAVIWLGELEEEDARGKVVNVGKAKTGEAVGELVRDNSYVQRREALFHRSTCSGEVVGEEKRMKERRVC